MENMKTRCRCRDSNPGPSCLLHHPASPFEKPCTILLALHSDLSFSVYFSVYHPQKKKKTEVWGCYIIKCWKVKRVSISVQAQAVRRLYSHGEGGFNGGFDQHGCHRRPQVTLLTKPEEINGIRTSKFWMKSSYWRTKKSYRDLFTLKKTNNLVRLWK